MAKYLYSQSSTISCRNSLLLMLFTALTVSCGTTRPEVYDLRCEGLQQPLAIDNGQPTFSWKVRSAKPVKRVECEVTGLNGESILLSGQGDDNWLTLKDSLPSRWQGWWRLRVVTADGKRSQWSERQHFGVGVTGGDTLRGCYIGAVPGEGRSPLLRKKFMGKSGVSALLHVNSLGYHEAWLNGKKVSDDVLAPAVSQLNKRSLICTYDVSNLLRDGENELLLQTGSGWYKPTTFGAQYEGPLVRAELDVVTREGMQPLVCTDSSWEGAWSGYSDLGTWLPLQFVGERMDARAFSDRHWGPVDVVNVPRIVASPQACEPCRVQETLSPVSIKADGVGRWLVDFGRIVNGMLDLRLPQLPVGHVTTASFSDFRNDEGKLDVMSRNEYVSSGSADGDSFQNRFNHHVFRYVLLEGLPEAPAVADIQARRIRTDFPRTASFRSSDEELNKIHDMVAYTLDNLAFNGYMVDCASIERLGYGGDGNASTQTLQTLFQTAPLYRNWLQAWVDAQQEDGGLPHTAPCPYRAGGGPYWCSFIVQAPWHTYMNYGDRQLLKRCYPAMKHWLDYVDAYTVGGLLKRWPDADYRYWYLGDWAAPEGVDVRNQESVDLVNNCALCQVYQQLETIAQTLGREADVADYRHRYDLLRERINKEFYHSADSTYASGSQVDMAYPLLVGIATEAVAPLVKSKLLESDRLMTGLVGVPIVTEWATKTGECNWMYSMLKQHSYPGYLFMLDQGATATWEHWNGERSRMHNCFNGIGSWFYQALGGITADQPGYRHVQIAPQMPDGLDWVEVSQETPFGTIVVKRQGVRLHVELPTGITATIQGREYTSGSYDLELKR